MKKYDLVSGQRCAVYDNGLFADGFGEKYAVCFVDCPENSGRVLALCCSAGGRYYSEFCAVQRGRHLGRRVPFAGLPEDTQKHIISRLQ